MLRDRKKPGSDLKRYYTILLESGLIIVLLFSIMAVKIDFQPEQKELDFSTEKEVVHIDQIPTSEHKKPTPPKPLVPVEVPNTEVIEEEIPVIDIDVIWNQQLELPAAPGKKDNSEEDFFVVVEEMPELIGGLSALQQKIRYPERARRAGIEGRVVVQFIVNTDGEVENPRVVRGIGGGCDEESLRAVKASRFNPGRQRGEPVRVQFSLPVVFKLKN
ncbi:MAG: energy transducer TonB [Balneolaceae bacterium]|nr:energy transducer TonB [Balneolaceae bacterium]